MPKVTIRPSAAADVALRPVSRNSSGLRLTWSAARTATRALRSRSAASTAATVTAGPESRRIGSSTMSASMPCSRNCSATTKRKSALVITIGRANNSASLTRQHLLQRRSGSDELDELLRHALARDRPQARSRPAAHNDRHNLSRHSGDSSRLCSECSFLDHHLRSFQDLPLRTFRRLTGLVVEIARSKRAGASVDNNCNKLVVQSLGANLAFLAEQSQICQCY